MFKGVKQNSIINITQTDKYSPYDFKIKVNNKIVYIELKSRTIKKMYHVLNLKYLII